MSMARLLSRLLHRHEVRMDMLGFYGDYDSWDNARNASRGYDDLSILEKTRQATAVARDDETAFERDSVLLPKPERPYQVIAWLLATALSNEGRLSVLDFGGALGSTYFQCRPLLAGIAALRWAVVEQPHYVAAGRREFSSDVLTFHDAPEEACAAVKPDLLLLSSVLAYLPEPYAMLDRLLRLGIPRLVVDRTPFLRSDRDRLTVQVVPPEIYPASYPAWFFGETKVLATFRRHSYHVADEWRGNDDYSPTGDDAVFKGLLFVADGSEHA